MNLDKKDQEGNRDVAELRIVEYCGDKELRLNFSLQALWQA